MMPDLREALSRSGYKRQSLRLVRPLELSVRRVFLQQGALMARKMRTLRSSFVESRDTGGMSVYELYAAFLNAPISEAALPSDWLRIWIEVAQATSKAFAAPIDKAAVQAASLGAQAAISELRMDLSFDLDNPRAVAYLKDHGARQVTQINETTWETLNRLVTQAADEGWSYARTAEAITDKFREFAVGRPQDHIDSRAHLVAVTEVGNAYEEGNLIVARDLQDAGLPVEKKWDTVGDSKVSAGCRENEDAGWIGVNMAFPSGHQRPLRFPGCRCELRYKTLEA